MARARTAVPPSAPKQKQTRRPSWDDVELVQLEHPTRFSDDDLLADALYVIRQIKQQAQHLAQLKKALGVLGGYEDPHASCRRTGPKRGKHCKGGNGDWVLLYFGYVLLKKTAMLAFEAQPETFLPLVRECGFSEMPDYQLIRARFDELEAAWEAVAGAADEVIQRARRWEPRIGQVVLSDATGWETHARFEHCCPRGIRCAYWRKRWLARASAKEIRDERAKDADDPADEALPPKSLLVRNPTDVPERLIPPGGLDFEHYAYFVSKAGCLWRCRDRSAGARTYTHPDGTIKDSWRGGYGHPAIDWLTGAPLAVLTYTASEQEFRQHEDLAKRTFRALDDDRPAIWSADAGSSYEPVFRFNTYEKIASVIPWRPKGGQRKEDRHTPKVRRPWVDEHGVPRCAYCGGEGDQNAPGCGLVFDDNGKPQIAFYCTERIFPECLQTSPQRIDCERDYTLLVPLSRLHPLYHDVRFAHQHFEGLFAYWRNRYQVYGDDQTSRLKEWSNSVSAQRLRAEAARFLEWFRICLRFGWIAGHRNARQASFWSLRGRGQGNWKSLLAFRRKQCLDLPYGDPAERLGLVRPRGAPPPPEPEPNPDGSYDF